MADEEIVYTHRCFACSTPVRPGMGDWCRCLSPMTKDEWRRLQLEANKARNGKTLARAAEKKEPEVVSMSDIVEQASPRKRGIFG